MTSPRSNYAGALAAFGDLAVEAADAFARRGRWREWFSHRGAIARQLVFEIGCFDADLLERVAAAHPDVGFVGLDWKFKAIHDAAARVKASSPKNLALLRGRAQDLTRLFADGELDQIWLFHPDPCDKPKERPNRLFNEPFLLDARGTLAPGGTLALKTDHPGYHQHALVLLGLPQPPWFEPARAAGRVPAGAPKTRVADLVSPDELPRPSARVVAAFDVTLDTTDFWHDPAARSVAAARIWGNETSLFERRYLRRKLPIYAIELRAND